MTWDRVIFLACIGIVVAAASWIVMQDSSYEECMLSRMKGQPQAMYSTVAVLCSRKFKKEMELIDGRETEWGYKFFHVTVVPKDHHSNYVFTRGTFRFSSKPCAEAKDADFSAERTEAAQDDGTFHFPVPPDETISTPTCMKTLRIWGRFK